MTKLQLREKSLLLQHLMSSQPTQLPLIPQHLHPMLSHKLPQLLPLRLRPIMSRQELVAQGQIKDHLAHASILDFNSIAKLSLLFVNYLFLSSQSMFVYVLSKSIHVSAKIDNGIK